MVNEIISSFLIQVLNLYWRLPFATKQQIFFLQNKEIIRRSGQKQPKEGLQRAW